MRFTIFPASHFEIRISIVRWKDENYRGSRVRLELCSIFDILIDYMLLIFIIPFLTVKLYCYYIRYSKYN